MIENKKTQLRKRMRRIALDEHFNKIRNNLLRAIQLQSYTGQTQIRNQFIACLREMGGHLEEMKYQAAFKCLLYLQDRMNQSAQISMLLFQQSKLFSSVIKVAIHNSLLAQQRNQQIQQQFLYRLLQLLESLNFIGVPKNDLEAVIDAFWTLFRQNSATFYSNERMMVLSLIIIHKMLETETLVVFDCLKEVGLGSKLAMIFDSQISHSTNMVTKVLLSILEKYLEQQVSFHQNSEVCQVQGIHIEGIESNQKTLMMAFCLSIIKVRKQEFYITALNSLLIIFKKYEYLASQITIQEIKKQLFQMIQSPIRAIRMKSLSVLDIIVFNSKDVCVPLLQNMVLPNLFQEVLAQEHSHTDTFTQDIVSCISDILCNLTAGIKKRDIKDQFLQHFIWDFAYQHVYPGSPLVELISVFQYYFDKLGKNTKIQFFESYLGAVAQLQFSQLAQRIVQSISRTITRMYVKCEDYWPQQMTQEIINSLKRSNLYYLIEQLIPEQEQNIRPV